MTRNYYLFQRCHCLTNNLSLYLEPVAFQDSTYKDVVLLVHQMLIIYHEAPFLFSLVQQRISDDSNLQERQYQLAAKEKGVKVFHFLGFPIHFNFLMQGHTLVTENPEV